MKNILVDSTTGQTVVEVTESGMLLFSHNPAFSDNTTSVTENIARAHRFSDTTIAKLHAKELNKKCRRLGIESNWEVK